MIILIRKNAIVLFRIFTENIDFSLKNYILGGKFFMAEQKMTQLEEKLFEKIKNIENLGIKPQYLPSRVEPGVAYQLTQENRWSKYSGESLFINQEILADDLLQESIFWREAFLFFAPKEMRNTWWVRVLANSFPFSIKQTIENYDNWERLWDVVIDPKLENAEKFRRLTLSIGPLGLIDALRICLQQTFVLQKDLKSEKNRKATIELNHKEFSLILSQIQKEAIGLNDSAIDIMKIALIKQTTKPKELEKYSDKSKSTISKSVKKLLDMQVLYSRYQVNIHLLNLGKHLILLSCTKKQYEKIRYSIPKHPFLFSYSIHRSVNYIIGLQFVGPRTKEFNQHLVNYCKQLESRGSILEYYVFEIINSLRNYNFKYFDPKTKTQNLNINDIAVNYSLLRDISQDQKEKYERDLDNIVIHIPQFSQAYHDIELADLEIINQIFDEKFTRRAIQKAVKKDMNEIVKRLKKLEENEILTEDVFAHLPNTSTIIFIIEEDKKSKKEDDLLEKLKLLSYNLPDVFFAELKGTFKGIYLCLSLPNTSIIQFVDFINFYLPKTTTIIPFISKEIERKNYRQLPLHRWINNEWQFEDSDFNL